MLATTNLPGYTPHSTTSKYVYVLIPIHTESSNNGLINQPTEAYQMKILAYTLAAVVLVKIALFAVHAITDSVSIAATAIDTYHTSLNQ